MISWHISHLTSGTHFLEVSEMLQRNILWNKDSSGASQPQIPAQQMQDCHYKEKGKKQNNLPMLTSLPKDFACKLLMPHVTAETLLQPCDP